MELPVGVGVLRRIVRRDAPAVDNVACEEAVRAGDDAKVGELPREAVGGLGIADVAEPVHVVPESEPAARRIPPEAAVCRAGEIRRVVGRGEVGDARHGAGKTGPDDGAIHLHGLVPMTDDTRARFHEEVVHEELPSDGYVNSVRFQRSSPLMPASIFK